MACMLPSQSAEMIAVICWGTLMGILVSSRELLRARHIEAAGDPVTLSVELCSAQVIKSHGGGSWQDLRACRL